MHLSGKVMRVAAGAKLPGAGTARQFRMPLWGFFMQRRMLRISIAGVTAVATAALGLQFLPASAAPARTSPALAPAVAGAAAGGHVIVILKDQFTHLTLRSRGAARTAAVRRSQNPVVASIRASGGTGITRPISANGVAPKIT